MFSSWHLEYLDDFFQLLKECGDNSGITICKVSLFPFSKLPSHSTAERMGSLPVAVGVKQSTPLHAPSSSPAHPFLAPQVLQHEVKEVAIQLPQLWDSVREPEWLRGELGATRAVGLRCGVWIDLFVFTTSVPDTQLRVWRQHFQGFHCFPGSRKCFS